MLVILPPSETKVMGGDPSRVLDLESLSFSSQIDIRRSLVDQTMSVSQELEPARTALKLGPQGDGDILRNRDILFSPVMPALSRYTGVLYDALDKESLSPEQNTRCDASVAVFSALWGLIRASDLIPSYRLSYDSRLPRGSVQAQWKEAMGSLADNLWSEVEGFVLDLRSEGYRGLAPVPAGIGVYLALVQPGERGARKALGHGNKAAKGTLVRDLITSGATLESLDDLVAWGIEMGYDVDSQSYGDGRIDCVISGS